MKKYNLRKTIEVFDKIAENINRNKDVKAFIEEQCHNTRNSVKKKAEKLLKKIEKKLVEIINWFN